ncbi:MAG: serine hydrolase [Chitinophagales bacterium]
MRKILFIFTFILLSNFLKAQLYFPPKTGTTWDTMSPNRLGWCQKNIDSLTNFLQRTNTKGFIILKDGKIVVEKYFGTFVRDSIHYWASAGKSLTATMVGIAQQKGLLNINDSVSKYLGVGWSSETPQKEKLITIKNLLTMTSGMDDSPPSPCTNEDYSTACLQYKVDAGTRWAYHTGAYKKLEEVVAAASGKTYNAATNEWIEAYTGMSGAWIPSGVYFSTTRDMARFGLLTLNKGIWQSDTVLRDTAYYRAMTNTSQNFNLAYGYLWWLNGKASAMVPGLQTVFPFKLIPNAPNDLFCALGKYDQKIYVIPSTKMVIVRTGESGDNALAVSAYDTLIWKYINQLNSGCTVTSVKENKIENQVSIFPNPTKNTFFIKSDFNENYSVNVYNMQGQILQEQKNISDNFEFDVSGYDKGVYFVRIFNGNGFSEIKKLMITR